MLEHPEASAAWAHFGLAAPPKWGGWHAADFHGGWTCCVEQGHYGHQARKATWLYAVRTPLPSLRWGKSAARARLDHGFHSKEERARARLEGRATLKRGEGRLPTRLNAATPLEFREVLLSLARGVSLGAAVALEQDGKRGDFCAAAAGLLRPRDVDGRRRN